MAVAQKSASPARIVETINDSQLVTLSGNTHPAANAQNDLGRVASNLPMSDLILVLKRSPEQQAAFDAFVASQYDISSPNFHHWLEAAEIGERFGPAPADIATVSNWLSQSGFSVDEISPDRMTIRFGGTASQVQRTFHTAIHNLSVKGERHIGNMSDPQIPMALDPVVAGVKALHDFNPRPLHRLGSKASLNKDTGRWERIGGGLSGGTPGIHANAAKPQPELGITIGTGTSAYLIEDLAPSDFAAIYNVLPLWNAASPIDGTGQTIAIVGTSRVLPADVASFRSLFGLPATPAFTTVLATTADPGLCTSASQFCTLDDQVENALDVEWSGAVAKKAQVVLVVSGATSLSTDTVYLSANYAIQHNTAKILNVSYGLCELGMGTSGNTSYNNLWQTAASAGIAVFVASGDSGSPACDQGQAPGTPYGAQYGLSVSGLASPQYVTAVGGTDLNWPSSGTPPTSPNWNATNDPTTGANAKGYMPEIPWNDSCSNPLAAPYFASWAKAIRDANLGNPADPTDASSSCNFVADWWQLIYNETAPNSVDLSGFINTVGAGGGASNCTTSDQQTVASCTGGYAKPSWQAGVTGIPADAKRDIPDVSFFASPGFLGSAYLICVSANGACLTSVNPAQEPFAQEIGGTSAASPAMAGVMALINQKAGSPQGNPNAELYTLAAKQTYSSCKSDTGTTSNGCYFNDIDTGTISMACALGTPNCTVSSSTDTFGILDGYSGTVGFDLATGLGSLNVANVVNGWTAATGTGTATVTIVPGSSSIVSNVALTVTGTVTGSSGTPTGTVTLTGGGYTSAATALVSGAYSITIPANKLSAGSDTLTATYSGDATYASASKTAVVTVTAPVLLTPTVTVSPAASSIATGQSLNVVVNVTGSGATPTGTVVLTSGSFASATRTLAGGTYTFALPGNTLAAGTDTLTVTYSGDAAYGTATGTNTVTVTGSTYTLAASQPTAAISKGGSASSTVTLTSSNFYTGTVTLTCALTTSPAGAVKLPSCSAASPGTITATGGTPGGTATVNVTTTAAVAALVKPKVGGWANFEGGAVLALLVLFGIPARRRSWRAMLGVLALMVALGGLAACGGGGGSSSNPGTNGTPGTTSGAYTFTVTGTGSPAVTPAPTQTFTVTVN